MSDAEKTKLNLNVEIDLQEYNISAFNSDKCSIDICFSGDVEGTIHIYPRFTNDLQYKDFGFGDFNEDIYPNQDIYFSAEMLTKFKEILKERIESIVVNRQKEIEKSASTRKARQETINELTKDPAVQKYIELCKNRY